MSTPDRESPGETLRTHGLHPRKRFGQNFLSDPAILASIADAAALTVADVVLEVGPGTGLLTDALAAQAGCVVAVEIDRDLAAVCRERFADRPTVTIVEADACCKGSPSPALWAALAAARGDRPWKLVANLPYQVAAPLLLGCFQADPPPVLAVVTVQREMADRLRAAPGSAHYGALGVRFQLRAGAEVVRHLPAGAFWPRPAVRSSVVRCRPRPAPDPVPAGFDAVVQACFDHRRKQVPAALAAAGLVARATAVAALRDAGLPIEIRGESLEPAAFVRLAALLDASLTDR